MKILLIYPPDRAFPATPYSSLPILASSLRKAGHEVVLRDVSLEVFMALAHKNILLEYWERWKGRLLELEQLVILSSEEETEYKRLYQILSIPRDFLETVANHISFMKDPKQFYEPECFTHSWDALRGVLRFY